MNILGQVIPGIREARTPFAIGVVWSLIGIVSCSLVPRDFWNRPIFGDVAQIASALPVEVAVSIALFLVYILGVLLESIGIFVRGVILFILIPLSCIFGAMAAIARTWPLLLTFGALTLFLLFTVSYLRYKRFALPGFDLALIETITHGFEYVEKAISFWVEKLSRAFSTDLEIVDEVISDELEVFFDSYPDYLEQSLSELDRDQLFGAAAAVRVSVDEVRGESSPARREQLRSVREFSDLRVLALTDPNEPDDNVVRKILADKLKEDADYRKSYLLSLAEFAPLRKKIVRRYERAEFRLRGDPSGLFSEFDRLRAEGEFRLGLSIPVAALLALLAYRWHLFYGTNSSLTVFFACAIGSILIWGFMAGSGWRQGRKARRILYESVRSGIVETGPGEVFTPDTFVYRQIAPVAQVSIFSYTFRTFFAGVKDSLLRRFYPKYWEETRSEIEPRLVARRLNAKRFTGSGDISDSGPPTGRWLYHQRLPL